MKIKNVKKLMAVILSTSCIMTSGCSAFVGENVMSYPLEPMLTKQELIDYYSKALEYDSIVSRNLTIHETTYVTQDITGDKAERLKLLQQQCEAILGQESYEVTEENLKLVSPDTFEYIKASLDNLVLTNSKIVNIQGALGYYFVDVDYQLSPKQTGTFNQLTSLIGLNGAFYQNYDKTYSLDTAYLKDVVKSLNEYFYENNIIKCATFDSGTGIFTIEDGIPPEVYTTKAEVSNLPNVEDLDTDLSTNSTNEDTEETGEFVQYVNEGLDTEDIDKENIEDNDSEESTELEDTEELGDTTEDNIDDTSEVTTDENNTSSGVISTDGLASLESTQTYNSIVSSDRKIQFDTELINSVAGSSLRQSAVLPNLDYIYNFPNNEGTISGYGIFASGASGLKVFGFDRNQLAGNISLRYVFKDDSNGTGAILGTNVYITEENITNGVNMTTNTVLIPEFLQTEFEKIVERADRVMVNCDLSGIMSGHLYEDMGVGVLRGYKDKSTGVTKYMSTIRQVINRDTSNNSYLIDVETTTIEGAKDVDCYGTYKDRYYIVIQQQGNEFKIIDYLLVSRQMASEPPINPDSTIQKRLVALNLAGEIPDESKADITQLLSDLYTAGTNRLLRGPKDVTINGETVTIQKGLYDVFQNDTSILSTESLEYQMSLLQNVLVRHGADISAIYSGTVTEWIGGYENQAEFTTEELVSYNGTGDGYYMQVYYLVSKLNDVWVIDERTILDTKESVEGGELDNIKQRVGQ